jgi:hypothetical protein
MELDLSSSSDEYAPPSPRSRIDMMEDGLDWNLDLPNVVPKSDASSSPSSSSTASTTVPEPDPLEQARELAIALNQGKRILFHGPGGTGKSKMAKDICNALTTMNIPYQVVTNAKEQARSFGFNATHIHDFLGMGVPRQDGDAIPDMIRNNLKVCMDNSILNALGDDYAKIVQTIETEYGVFNKEKAKLVYNKLKRILRINVLIVDEVSNVGKMTFEEINRKLNMYLPDRNDNEPTKLRLFGGIGILLIGDMLQTAPVKDAYPFQSKLWSKLELDIYTFTTMYRFTDQVWANRLLRLRKGMSTIEDLDYFKTLMDNKDRDGIKICVTRKEVTAHNNLKVEELPGEPSVYQSTDSITKEGGGKCAEGTLEKYVKMYDGDLDADKTLILKIGAPVMVLRNNPKLDIDNGTRGVITKLCPPGGEITIRLDTDGRIVNIGRVDVTKVVGGGTYEIKRCQYPIRAAYAATTPKVQGKTEEKIQLDYGKDFAGAGTVYVGMSRARSPTGITLTAFNPKCIKVNNIALEFVSAIED